MRYTYKPDPVIHVKLIKPVWTCNLVVGVMNKTYDGELSVEEVEIQYTRYDTFMIC